jgi:predicted RNase H-like nuclease (RuvC/YqgF family)
VSKALRDLSESRERNKNLSSHNRELERETEKLRGMLASFEESMREGGGVPARGGGRVDERSIETNSVKVMRLESELAAARAGVDRTEQTLNLQP